MRCSCLGRASLLALVLVVLILSAMRGVAGSWTATPLAAVEWGTLAGGLGEGAAALLAGIGRAIEGLLKAIWHSLVAIPWRAGIEAVVGFVAALGAGFVALVRDLGGAVLGFVADLGRDLAYLAGEAWRATIGLLRSLVRSPASQELDPRRLALVTGGWLLVLALAAWFAIRLLWGWLRALWGRLTRRCGTSRPRTPARA